MAEILGIGLAVVQICGMSEGINRLGRALWTLSQDKTIGVDIDMSLKRLTTVRRSIKCVIETLQMAIREHPDLRAVKYLARYRIVSDIGDQADYLNESMKTMAARIASRKRLQKLRWILSTKQEVDALLPLTNHLQLSLQIASTSILLEAIGLECDKGQVRGLGSIRDSFRAELRRFRDEVADLIKNELDVARERLFGSANPLPTNKLAKPLRDLADSLCETGHVPEYDGSRSSRSSTLNTVVTKTLSEASPLTPPSSLPSASPVTGLSLDTNAEFETPPRSPIGAHSSRSCSTSTSTVGHMELVKMNATEVPDFASRADNSLRCLQLPPKSDQSKLVRPEIPNILLLSQNAYRPCCDGHLGPDDSLESRVTVTARQARSLTVNLISLAQARDLRLQIEYEDGKKTVLLLENEGFTYIVGAAEAYWWIESGDLRKAVSSIFYVCARLDEGIILGKPLLEDIERRSKGLHVR